MNYIIQNDCLTVQIAEHGAEPVSVLFEGKEQLWQNENGTWTGHSPILFPICGVVEVKVDGKVYPNARHGFARNFDFALKEKGENFVTLYLQENEETLKRYPFRFCFTITYRLVENTIRLEYQVENKDEKPLFFSYGGHESFMLDEKESYFLRFPKEEEFVACVHNDSGQLTGEKRKLGTGKELVILPEYLADFHTVILDGLNSRSATLCKRDGTPVYETQFEGLDKLLLWSPCVGRMICIEPWGNLPDGVNDTRELCEKGFFRVEADATFTATRTLVYCKN